MEQANDEFFGDLYTKGICLEEAEACSLVAARCYGTLGINLHLVEVVSSLSQRKHKTYRCLATRTTHRKPNLCQLQRSEDSITHISQNSGHCNRNSPSFLSLVFHCSLWGQNQITSLSFAHRQTEEILTYFRGLLGQL